MNDIQYLFFTCLLSKSDVDLIFLTISVNIVKVRKWYAYD